MNSKQKVFIHTAMSLDGFVAGPDSEMSWIFSRSESTLDLSEHIKSIGAVIMGRRTHEVDIKQRPKPEKNFVYGGAYEGPIFVLSNERNNQELDTRVKYISGDIRDKIREVAASVEAGNILLLGANVWRQGLEAGLVDEVLIHVVPVLLGDGMRFYSISGAELMELELKEAQKIGKLAELRFKVGKSANTD